MERTDIPVRLLDCRVQIITRELRSKVARVLLVVPTSSYRIADFIDAAGALGVEVAVAAEEDLPLLAIDRFVRIDCSDPVAAAATVVDLAATTSIDAIVPVDDAGVVIAALASESLGLPHNPPAAAAATRDKHAMRLALSRGEVPQPSFAAIALGQDPTTAAAAIGFPLVVKPLSLSGSQGVIKVDSPDQLPSVIERVLDIAKRAGDDGGRVLLEQFVPGPEVAVEGMLWGGALEVLAIFDKPDHPDGPYFEETIYVTPSRLDRATQDEIGRVTQVAITAIGLKEGPIHAELRVDRRKPAVIEVAGRSIGGICGRALSFGLLDTSLETLILRHALGRRRGLPRTRNASGVMMIPIAGPGTLTAIGGLDDAGKVEGIDAIEITAPIGTHLRPVPESDRYLGFIFATGPEADDVVAALKKAHSLLDIVIR
jgi:biotin carboxylase